MNGGARQRFTPVQVAYHVPDPEIAAHRLARRFGWGPFFLFEHIALASCRYRGEPARFDHTSAYGQGGELMIELITQHDDSPSVLRERFGPGETGVHHVARFVDDLPAALAAARTDGIAVALEARTATGTDFAMLDTVADLGHMVELYVGAGDLLKFYRYVRRAADGWDGGAPLHRLSP